MEFGAITRYVDLAQILLYAFWLFFAGLIYYLVREGHREGYPMESDSLGRAPVNGWPIPSPKTYKLADGSSVTVPELHRPELKISAVTTGPSPGSPIEPTGDPMASNAGPGAYALRADKPDMTVHGDVKIVPLRVAAGCDVARQDTDPRGLPVFGADGKQGGTVRELWLDRAEMLVRYLEVTVANAALGPNVLLPIPFARIRKDRIEVNSLLGHQIANVPRTRHPDQITFLEEEKVCAYYGAGTLYAEPQRSEPLI